MCPYKKYVINITKTNERLQLVCFMKTGSHFMFEHTRVYTYQASTEKFYGENIGGPTIPDKIFGSKWNNPVKLDKRRKVWYLFLRVF